jgi:WD40 repeat protein
MDLQKQGPLVYSAGADKSIRVWNPSTFKEMQRVTQHTSFVGGLVPVGWQASQLMWSYSNDKSIKLWNVAGVDVAKQIQAHISELKDKCAKKQSEVNELRVAAAARDKISTQHQAEVDSLSDNLRDANALNKVLSECPLKPSPLSTCISPNIATNLIIL